MKIEMISKGFNKVLGFACGVLAVGSLVSKVSAVSVYYVSCYRSNICQPVYGMPPCDGAESISGYLTSTSETRRQNSTFNSYELTQSLSGQLTVFGTKAGRPEVRRNVTFSGTYQYLRNPSPSYNGTIVSLSAWAPTGDSFTNWISYSPYYQVVQYLSIAGRSSYANATCSFFEM